MLLIDELNKKNYMSYISRHPSTHLINKKLPSTWPKQSIFGKNQNKHPEPTHTILYKIVVVCVRRLKWNCFRIRLSQDRTWKKDNVTLCLIWCRRQLDCFMELGIQYGLLSLRVRRVFIEDINKLGSTQFKKGQCLIPTRKWTKDSQKKNCQN